MIEKKILQQLLQRVVDVSTAIATLQADMALVKEALEITEETTEEET